MEEHFIEMEKGFDQFLSFQGKTTIIINGLLLIVVDVHVSYLNGVTRQRVRLSGRSTLLTMDLHTRQVCN